MNISENMKAFDLQQAIAGHPLTTREGVTAKFIAYVPENQDDYRFIVNVDKQVSSYCEDGYFYASKSVCSDDLFLAPLGYCEGKPVFAGDRLVHNFDKSVVTVDIQDDCFDNCKWPSKAAIVQTRMTALEINDIYDSRDTHIQAIKLIANKAIERAITDGDVISTSVVKELQTKAYNQCVNLNASFKENFDAVLNKYLEGLK